MLDLPECFGIEAAIEDTVMEQHYDGFDIELEIYWCQNITCPFHMTSNSASIQ